MRNFDTDCALGGAGTGSSVGRCIDLTDRIAVPGLVMGFARNEEIFGEEETADFVYRVVSGVVRTTRLLSDGRRQVAGFYFTGDVFGLEPSEIHQTCAEAITDCRIALVKRAALERAADREVSTARELWAITARDLQRMQAHMLLLGRKGAVERLAIFLLDMETRTAGRGSVDLPMSRIDIADYLGMTFETVSRSLTQLERDGVIALPTTRHIELRDRRALAAYQA
jgi:CRP/FNR family nitrogen fixation transcriptional regulator